LGEMFFQRFRKNLSLGDTCGKENKDGLKVARKGGWGSFREQRGRNHLGELKGNKPLGEEPKKDWERGGSRSKKQKVTLHCSGKVWEKDLLGRKRVRGGVGEKGAMNQREKTCSLGGGIEWRGDDGGGGGEN